MDVEICINCDSEQPVAESVSAALQGGAARVELCSAMHEDGLTPVYEKIAEARKVFANREGVMVMIRPRAGDFCYSAQEIAEMHTQIQMAASAGADGVVLGVLEKLDSSIAIDTLIGLMATSNKFNLQTTFHRAFDAAPDPLTALKILKSAGMQRILTSGVPWRQKGTALDGKENLQKLIRESGGAAEIVIGGGVNKANIVKILDSLPLRENLVSLHAYSGAKIDGIVTVEAVRQLVAVAREYKIKHT